MTAEITIASPPNVNVENTAVATVVVEAPTTTTTAPAAAAEVVPTFTG